MIDEKTFNEDIREIQQSVDDISDNSLFYQWQFQIIDICESLLEAMRFQKTRWMLFQIQIHSHDLMNCLKEISNSITNNNLPLAVNN